MSAENGLGLLPGIDIPKLRGMSTVRVKREAVLEKLHENREGHRAVFEEAIEGYHRAVIRALEESLSDAMAGRRYKPAIMLPEPQDHTRDYDRVIEMLSMSLDDEMELTDHEFAMYVQDDWGWKGDFVGTTRNYTNQR